MGKVVLQNLMEAVVLVQSHLEQYSGFGTPFHELVCPGPFTLQVARDAADLLRQHNTNPVDGSYVMRVHRANLGWWVHNAMLDNTVSKWRAREQALGHPRA